MSEAITEPGYTGSFSDDFDLRSLLPLMPETRAQVDEAFDRLWRGVPFRSVERVTAAFDYADPENAGSIQVDCMYGVDPAGDGNEYFGRVILDANPTYGLWRPTDPGSRFASRLLLGKILDQYQKMGAEAEAEWLFRAYELAHDEDTTAADIKALLAATPGGSSKYKLAVLRREAPNGSIFQGSRLKQEGEYWELMEPEDQALHFSYYDVGLHASYDGQVTKAGGLEVAIYDMLEHRADPEMADDRRSTQLSECYAHALVVLLNRNFGLSKPASSLAV